MKSKTKFKETEVGFIPSSWNIIKLKDLADVDTGFAFKSIKYSTDQGIRVVRGENLGFRTFNWKKTKKWNNVDDSLKKYHLTENTVVLSMDGNVGKNKAVVSKKQLPLLLAQRVASVVSRDKKTQDYVNQAILSDYFQKYCNQVKTGTTISHISKGQIENFIFPFPDKKSEQQLISKILSDLDAKIELNNEMNETFEKIALAIFKQWFIHFEFPIDKKNSYKSFGGKLIKSEGIEIPKDWKVKPLSNLIDIVRGMAYTSKEKTITPSENVFITLNNISEFGKPKTKYFWIVSDRIKEKHRITEGELIIANTHFGVGGSNTGRLLGFPSLVIFPYDNVTKSGVFSNDLTKIIPFCDELKYYLYFILLLNQQDTATRYKTGTSILHLNHDGFLTKTLVIEPPKPILEKFNKIINPIFNKIISNQKETMNLTKMRNSLVPKLMSGKIQFKRKIK